MELQFQRGLELQFHRRGTILDQNRNCSSRIGGTFLIEEKPLLKNSSSAGGRLFSVLKDWDKKDGPKPARLLTISTTKRLTARASTLLTHDPQLLRTPFL
jgi:hypothetical protein